MLAQADVFVKYGLAERAVDHLRRIFGLEPNHRGARERLASVLSQLGRRSEAAAELATLAAQLAGGTRRRRRAGGGARADPGSHRARRPPSCWAASSPRRPRPRPGAARDDLATELEQVDFFMQQSLHEEARRRARRAGTAFSRRPTAGRETGGAGQRAARRRCEADVRRRSGGDSGQAGRRRRSRRRARADRQAQRLGSAPIPSTHGDLGIAYKQMGLYDAAIAEFTAAGRSTVTRAVFATDDDRRMHRSQGRAGRRPSPATRRR